jgi:glycosyltransferase involved in cell wall biosynthesis
VICGRNLSVVAVPPPAGRGAWRKACLPLWLARNLLVIFREIRQADAVHTPIPGDIGTIGMLGAFFLRKPLFVRHCGNWFAPVTAAERFWRWFMERFAGGRNVMLATGGTPEPPSRRNPAVQWVFSTSLREEELRGCAGRREPPPAGSGRLMIACRQEREKGTGVVIESLPQLLPEFPGLTLDVVGDGGALDEFRRLAACLGVEDRVTFHGKVNHARVIALLQQAHLFCFPTTSSEGFPKVVLEALACGVPVVTTRVSVLPQLIGTGCGSLIEEATAPAVAGAIRQCLTDASLYHSMSAQAMATASGYSLERWRDVIGAQLRGAWGRSLA